MKSPAVATAIDMLRELARAGGTPVSISELARRLEAPKSSVANFCETLEDLNFVERREAGYVIGWGAAEVGYAYSASLDPVKEFYRFWNNAKNHSFEHTVQLAVLVGGIDMMFIARRAGTEDIQLVGSIGKLLPATCTAAGKALLASLSLEDLEDRLLGLDKLPGMTGKSQTSVEGLRIELADIRASGRSVNDEGTTLGVYCVGSALRYTPFVDPGSSPFAISMTAVKGQMASGVAGAELTMMSKFNTLLDAISPHLVGMSTASLRLEQNSTQLVGP